MLDNCNQYNNGPKQKVFRTDAEKLRDWADRIFDEGLAALSVAASKREKKLLSQRHS